MDRHCGLSAKDALTKSLEISEKDAEHFPNEKDKILSCENIYILSQMYTIFDNDIGFNHILSIESNRRRLQNELTYIFKIWMMDSWDNVNVNRKIHLGDRMRFITLASKYSINIEYKKFNKIFFIFPDIFCSLLLKHPNNIFSHSQHFNVYKNFKNEHKSACYIGMLPSGKMYGGFVKAIVHLYFMNCHENFFIFMLPGVYLLDHVIAGLRAVYNTNIISQEKRLKFFENLDIKEADCTLWSQHFDREFPKFSYIHTLFGQHA